MKYLTNEKLTIVGAGGAIGSNMVQTALMLGLTPNICLYDIFEPGVHGVAEEMKHCAFEGANITWTINPEEAFKDAKYIISSGGAPRKEGMTREDLLKGNCQIAAQFGDFIKQYCPDVKHVVVIFNPADVTALTALIHSGVEPNRLTSLAALDSTRLQQQIAEHLGLPVISYAEDIKIEGDSVVVKRQYEDRYHMVKAQMPCLVTALSELNEPRYMTPGGIFDACDKEVTVWGRADLKDVDDSNLGLKGSPTKIAKASDKVAKGAGEKVNLDPSEAVAYLMGKFKEKHII